MSDISEKRKTVGRRPTNARRYYSKPDDKGECTCLVVNRDGRICEKKLSGRYGGNLKAHLRSCHREVYADVAKDEQIIRAMATKSVSRQQNETLWSFANVNHTMRKYPPGGIDDTRKTEALALLIAGMNLPKSIVDHPIFQYYSARMDPHYKVPNRQEITTTITNLRQNRDHEVKLALNSAKRVAIVVSLYSKDNTPFIGIMVHFFNRKSKRRCHASLCLKTLPQQHTSADIYNKVIEILSYWDIDEQKIYKILIDNASISASAENDVMMIANGDATDFSPNADEESDSDESMGCVKLESSFHQDQERKRFDHLQQEMQLFWPRKHLRCIVHSLQFIIENFIKTVNQENNIISSALALVDNFRRNPEARCVLSMFSKDKRLYGSFAGRWQSLYEVLRRLLEVRECATTICNEQSMDCLSPGQWKQLTQLCAILEPFARVTSDLHAYKTTTLSLVAPYVEEIRRHMEQMIRETDFQGALRILNEDLEECFDFVVNTNSPDFDPTYVVATALDPRYKGALNQDQLKAAWRSLLQQLTSTPSHQNAGKNDCNSAEGTQSSEAYRMKRFRYLEVRHEQPANTVVTTDKVIDRYFTDFPNLDESVDPVEWWLQDIDFPLIADLAVDILVTPCSSASVDYMCSHAGVPPFGMHRGISPAEVENQLMITTNWFSL